MKFFVKIDLIDNCFRYRENPLYGWSYTPDSVKTVQDLKHFLSGGGRLDEAAIIFTDDHNKPCKYYAVTSKKAGGTRAIEDGEYSLPIPDEVFMSETEQIDFIKGIIDRNLEVEADKIADTRQRLAYLKSKADQTILDGLKYAIEDRIEDDKITAFCNDHAAKYSGLEAKIIFKK